MLLKEKHYGDTVYSDVCQVLSDLFKQKIYIFKFIFAGLDVLQEAWEVIKKWKHTAYAHASTNYDQLFLYMKRYANKRFCSRSWLRLFLGIV